MTYNIVKDGKINIPHSMWKNMNEKLSKDEIIEIISDTIEDCKISLPYSEITTTDAEEQFSALCAMISRTRSLVIHSLRANKEVEISQ